MVGLLRRQRAIPGLPGDSIIYQGTPSIFLGSLLRLKQFEWQQKQRVGVRHFLVEHNFSGEENVRGQSIRSEVRLLGVSFRFGDSTPWFL